MYVPNKLSVILLTQEIEQNMARGHVILEAANLVQSLEHGTCVCCLSLQSLRLSKDCLAVDDCQFDLREFLVFFGLQPIEEEDFLVIRQEEIVPRSFFSDPGHAPEFDGKGYKEALNRLSVFYLSLADGDLHELASL